MKYKKFFLISLLGCNSAILAASCPQPDQIHFTRNDNNQYCMTSHAQGMNWNGKCFTKPLKITALKQAKIFGTLTLMNEAEGSPIACDYSVANSTDSQELFSPNEFYRVKIGENGWVNWCHADGIPAICTGTGAFCPFDIVPH